MGLEANVKKMRTVLGDAVIASTFKKLAEIELEKCRRLQGRLKGEIGPFERRFKMTSEHAWAVFQEGKLGDDGDVMEWMMLYKNYLALEDQCKKIQEIDLT
jgi:hypothetical protein